VVTVQCKRADEQQRAGERKSQKAERVSRTENQWRRSKTSEEVGEQRLSLICLRKREGTRRRRGGCDG